MRRALGLAAKVAVFAGAAAVGVAAGRQHERARAFGTAFWRAQAELALHLYDEPRLVQIQSQAGSARGGRHRLEDLLARSWQLVQPAPAAGRLS